MHSKPSPAKAYWLKLRFLLQLVWRVFLILLITFTLVLSQNVEPAEVIFGIFMISVTLISIPLHVECFRNAGPIVRYLNALFHIERIAGTQNI